MKQQKQFFFGVKPSPMGSIWALLTLALILVGIYYLIKGAYFVLGIIAPVLIILSLILDYQTVWHYIKNIINMLKQNPVMGILAVLLNIVAFPFVAGYLFAKVLMKRSLKKYVEEKQNPKYTEYEEVVEEEDFLILPDVEKVGKKRKKDNEYDDLFK